MTIGPLPDAMDPGFHGARTHWIRGFMAFRRARETYWIRGFMTFRLVRRTRAVR